MTHLDLDHDTARALCEAGYMPIPEYLRLCEENGWDQREMEQEGSWWWLLVVSAIALICFLWIAYNWSNA